MPDGEGPFPTVVWSHGGGFNDNGHRQAKQWGDALATHGYVVIHVAHTGLTVDGGLALCAAASVPTAECVPGGDEDDGLVALVKSHDIVAVLDALPMLSDASVAGGGPAIDFDRVAVAGWSAGSRAPLITHGAVFLPSASAPVFSLPHALPKAVLALSPIGPGYGGFFDDGSAHSWQGVRGPVLMITGDNDLKATKPDLTGLDRRVAFEKQPADGSRWLLYSQLAPGVGEHATYNLEQLGSEDERLVRFSRAERSAALAFFDAQLFDDPHANEWLASNNAATLAGEAEWVHK